MPPAVHTAGVDVVKVTARPDDAVAVTVRGEAARVFEEIAAKVIFWEA